MQTDPAKGASPWQRGVIADAQILVCPVCQQTHGWRGQLDRCAACASTRLVRRLGDTSCLDCQHVGPGLPAASAAEPDAVNQNVVRPLAAEVETALRRVLRPAPD